MKNLFPIMLPAYQSEDRTWEHSSLANHLLIRLSLEGRLQKKFYAANVVINSPTNITLEIIGHDWFDSKRLTYFDVPELTEDESNQVQQYIEKQKFTIASELFEQQEQERRNKEIQEIYKKVFGE